MYIITLLTIKIFKKIPATKNLSLVGVELAIAGSLVLRSTC